MLRLGLWSLVTLESSCNCGSVTVIVTASTSATGTRSTAGGKSFAQNELSYTFVIFLHCLTMRLTSLCLRTELIWDSLSCFSYSFFEFLWADVHRAVYLCFFREAFSLVVDKRSKKAQILKANSGLVFTSAKCFLYALLFHSSLLATCVNN